MSLLAALIDERARRKRIRMRLDELAARSARRDAWQAHWEYDEHDPRTCEYCMPVQQAHRGA